MAVQVRKTYLLGEFALDPGKKRLAREGRAVHLANRPFLVLLHLIENRDRMVSRKELLDHFWDGKEVYENTLTKCVGAIRKVMGDTVETPRFIETQWAKGYRYIGPLEESFSHAPEARFVEVEKERGFKVIIEEETIEILPDGEATAAAHWLGAESVSASPSGQPAGAARVKWRRNIPALVAVFIIAVAALLGGPAVRHRSIFSEARGSTVEALPIQSIAVLPLKNLSDDAANEYFSDGLTESFITELAKIDGLRVVSSNSVFTFKGQAIDPREIGHRLDVAAVLEGSVRQSGDSVCVDVRLVNTRDGSIIWTSDSYNRALKDILAVQDEIACSVAAGLRVKFCGEAEAAKRYTSNIEAYQAYLKGRYYWNKRTSDGILRSIDYFEHAIAIDPNYALAYAGLADSYIQGIWHVPFDSKAVLPKATAAALRAVEIDDQLAEAHTALANAYQLDWNWSGTEQEIEHALALNPRLARAHHVYAFHLLLMGRNDEALAAIKQAQAIDPLNMVINTDVAFILSSAGRQAEAIEQALKVVEMDPSFANAHLLLATAYHIEGRAEESLDEYLKAMALNGESAARVAAYRKAYREKGLRGIYQKELDGLLTKRGATGRCPPISVAWFYTLLGDKEEAFKWLEIACTEHAAEIVIAKTSAEFDPLRSDPRFSQLMRRIGLPD